MKDIVKPILGALIISGFFILLIFLVTKEIPIKNNDLLNLVVGALIGNFGAVAQYYFGSSSSSTKKDETISNALVTSTSGSNTSKVLLLKDGSLYSFDKIAQEMLEKMGYSPEEIVNILKSIKPLNQ